MPVARVRELAAVARHFNGTLSITDAPLRITAINVTNGVAVITWSATASRWKAAAAEASVLDLGCGLGNLSLAAAERIVREDVEARRPGRLLGVRAG